MSNHIIPLFSVLFGDQVPHIHREQLFSREPSQFRKRPIDEKNRPIGIAKADCILRGFENIFIKVLLKAENINEAD
jgi:hypothetical protein